MSLAHIDEIRKSLQDVAQQAPDLGSVTAKIDRIIHRRRARRLAGVVCGVVAILGAGPLLAATMAREPRVLTAAPATTSQARTPTERISELPRGGMCFSKVSLNSERETFVIAEKVGVAASKQRLSPGDFLDVCSHYWNGTEFMAGSEPNPSPPNGSEGLSACWLTDNVIAVFPRSPKVPVDDPCKELGMRAVTGK